MSRPPPWPVVVLAAIASSGVVAAGLPGGAPSAAAAQRIIQGGGAAETVELRQQAFKRLAFAFKLIHNEVRVSSPDTAKIGAAAAEVKAAASHLAEWFPAGSGPEAGLKTHAKPEIWSDGRGFAAARAAFIRQAEKSVRQLTDPGERAAWKDAAAALGQACRDCHDSYRFKAD